jgi:hypothetical protein
MSFIKYNGAAMSTLEALPWKDVFTIGAATLGAVLGVMNTWNAISTRRLRVKVTPNFVLDLAGQPLGASIEVTNLSAFPVSVAEVGFEAGGGKHVPIIQTRITLPHRLESRDSISIFVDPPSFRPEPGVRIGAAYVRTACGNQIRGNSPAGRQLSQILTEVARKTP